MVCQWIGCINICILPLSSSCDFASVSAGLFVYKGLCIDVSKQSFWYFSIICIHLFLPWRYLGWWTWLIISVFVKIYGWMCHCVWEHKHQCIYLCVNKFALYYCICACVAVCVCVLWVWDCMAVCVSVGSSGNNLALNQTTKSWNFYSPHLLARCKLYLQLQLWLILFYIFNSPGF